MLHVRRLSLILCLVFLFGCAYNPATVLDNNFQDLDLENRFEQYYSELKKGMKPYDTDIAIDVLLDDISKIKIDDERATDIFNLMTDAINKLKDGAESYMNEDYEQYDLQIEEAYKIYKQALRERSTFMADNNV